MTSVHKTVYAQKGIVVRIQVPEELWAGESRPIYAVLNGKYNDGTSKVGDVPWSYDIVWQFAEPVWEEEGTGEDVTYTPRPPETAQEYVPSQIMTGGHRVKRYTSPLYVGDMTSDSWGLVYVRAVISGVDVTNGEVTQCAGDETITSAWVEVFCLEELTVRSSETGEEIGGVSLYLPDDGTDRGEPHFVYHDPLYALGMSLPDGLTEEVDTMVTLWHNNTIYEWESVELTETGAETNVFSYDAGGVEITVTLDEGAELTAEYDAFGATVYRSDQVDPARRTFFEETDETTCTFESSIFGAQIALVDGLASDEPDIIQVMLYASTSSESYSFIATEDGNNTKRFVSQDGLWFVDLPASYTPTASIDAAIVTVFGPATAEPQEIRVVETGAETDVLVTMEYIDSEDTDYPDLADTVLHYVELTKWPAVSGHQEHVEAISGGVVTKVPATATPAGKFRTSNQAAVPQGETMPELSGQGEVGTVAIDRNVKRRREVLEEDLSFTVPGGADLRSDAGTVLYLFYGDVAVAELGDFPESVEITDEKALAAYSFLARNRRYAPRARGNKLLRLYGVDLIASGIPVVDSGGCEYGRDIAEYHYDYLVDELGHSCVLDKHLTTIEFASFFSTRVRDGLAAPVIWIFAHGSARRFNLVDDYRKKKHYVPVHPLWIRKVIAQTPGEHGAEALDIHMFYLGSCRAGGDDLLQRWAAVAQAYASFGWDKPTPVPGNKQAMRMFFKSHKAVPINPLGRADSVTESYAKLRDEIEKAYAGATLHKGYEDLTKLAGNQSDYALADKARLKMYPSIEDIDLSDKRNRSLDWNHRAIMDRVLKRAP